MLLARVCGPDWGLTPTSDPHPWTLPWGPVAREAADWPSPPDLRPPPLACPDPALLAGSIFRGLPCSSLFPIDKVPFITIRRENGRASELEIRSARERGLYPPATAHLTNPYPSLISPYLISSSFTCYQLPFASWHFNKLSSAEIPLSGLFIARAYYLSTFRWNRENNINQICILTVPFSNGRTWYAFQFICSLSNDIPMQQATKVSKS